MIAGAYYNEIDPYAAQWLRNLIKAGHIAPGDVDERDIRDVRPSDLRGYLQCHFFAGIGVWSYALRRAGWSDCRRCWTGSCPCQPFSVAGMGAGFDDERHLWPYFHHLIRNEHPPVVFGEQVASKDGLNWLDLVQSDMEGENYTFEAVDLCAAGVGAPHIRQRLWFMAYATGNGFELRRPSEAGNGQDASWFEPERLCTACLVGDTECTGLEGCSPEYVQGSGRRSEGREPASAGGSLRRGKPGPTNGFWRDADWLACRDGRWRPVEPGTFPLAYAAPGRVGRLRAYGNAINAEAAIEFIQVAMTVMP